MPSFVVRAEVQSFFRGNREASPLFRLALFCRPQLPFRAPVRLCPLFRSIIQPGNSAPRPSGDHSRNHPTLPLQTGLIKPCHLETGDSHLQRNGRRAEYESCQDIIALWGSEALGLEIPASSCSDRKAESDGIGLGRQAAGRQQQQQQEEACAVIVDGHCRCRGGAVCCSAAVVGITVVVIVCLACLGTNRFDGRPLHVGWSVEREERCWIGSRNGT